MVRTTFAAFWLACTVALTPAKGQDVEVKIRDLLGVTAADRARTPGLLPLASTSLPGGDASQLGRGFSALGNNWSGDCVDFDPSDGKPPVESVSTNFEVALVDSVDKFISIMNISASASMSYGIFSADASASYLRRVVENSYSNFIAGKVTVYSVPANIKAKGLNKLGRDALAAGFDRFHRTCGDRFATSVIWGGEFAFMLEIKSKDSAQFEEIKADLSASLSGFGSGEAAFSQSMEKISTKYSLTATIIRNGLRETLPDLTSAAIQKYAMEFSSRVTADKGIAMQPIRYGVRDYAAVEVRAPSYAEANISIAQIAASYLNARKVAGQVNYWMENPDQFLFVKERGAFERALLDAGDASSLLQVSARRCADRPSQSCKMPDALPLFDTKQLPPRLTWIKLPVDHGGWVSLGVVPAGQERRVRFRGQWSPSGGTTWWVPANNWSVRAIKQDGSQRDGEVGYGGDRIEVRLGDDPYTDNFQHPTDPASAALY